MADHGLESRLLVLAPTGRDAALTCDLLFKADLAASACGSVEVLCAEIERGCAGVMLAEEVMRPETTLRLLQILNEQPSWSDLPVIVFTGEGTTHPGLTRLVRTLGNVTVLDRPVRPVTMVSSARAALRARRRQYQARSELASRELAVEQRDRFLAMLGHELRNPLAAIRLAVSSLVPSDEAQTRGVTIIDRQSAALGRLVDDLLDVARVTSGKVLLQRQRLDLGEIVHDVVHTVQASADRGGIHLSVTREQRPLYVDGDRVRLEQVLTNVLNNALKYTQPQGHVAVEVRDLGGSAELVVTDDGAGMTREMVTRVFDLFEQADATLDRAQGGLGIGLTVAHALVGLHGGTITAESAGLGAGSSFTISLPLDPAVMEDEPAMMTTQNLPASSKSIRHRVLVVEDSDDIRDLTTMLISSYGHEVADASDGEAGLRAALESRPDVALVDLGLPGIDGFEVARRVRAALGDGIVLIALSGYGQAEDARRALDAGFDLHLVKPVEPARLRALLGKERATLRDSVRAQAHATASS